MERTPAILLLGPTASGKTPLGELIQRQGLWGRLCAHFDFGQALRDIVACGEYPGLSQGEVAVLAGALNRGALLENKDFRIAEAILRGFVDRLELPTGGRIALNGLPRHADQATGVDTIVAMQAVIELRCTPEAIAARIERNTGGDRAGRTDDSAAEVRKKLRIYQQRTAPVIDYYRGCGVRIVPLDVDAASGAEDMLGQLEARGEDR